MGQVREKSEANGPCSSWRSPSSRPRPGAYSLAANPAKGSRVAPWCEGIAVSRIAQYTPFPLFPIRAIIPPLSLSKSPLKVFFSEFRLGLPFCVLKLRGDGSLHLVEAVQTLDDAKARVHEWASHGPANTSFTIMQRDNGFR